MNSNTPFRQHKNLCENRLGLGQTKFILLYWLAIVHHPAYYTTIWTNKYANMKYSTSTDWVQSMHWSTAMDNSQDFLQGITFINLHVLIFTAFYKPSHSFWLSLNTLDAQGYRIFNHSPWHVYLFIDLYNVLQITFHIFPPAAVFC